MGILQPLTATSVMYLSLRGVCLKPLILQTQQLTGIFLESQINNRFPFLPPHRFNHLQFPAPNSLSLSLTIICFSCSPFCSGCSQTHLCPLQLLVLTALLFSLLLLPRPHLPAACAITAPTAVSAVSFVLPDQSITKDVKRPSKRSL